MKKTHLIYSAVIALMIGGIVPAMADGHGGGKGKHKNAMFEKLDTDKDGLVTKAEFMAHAEAKFAKMDADGNGSFTKEEAKAKHMEKKEARKARRDAKEATNE